MRGDTRQETHETTALRRPQRTHTAEIYGAGVENTNI
jgi:hypothetical protein